MAQREQVILEYNPSEDKGAAMTTWNELDYPDKRGARTLTEYVEFWPTNRHATVVTFQGEHVADTEVRYYDGNYDQQWLAGDIVSFVYVNNYTCTIKSMNIGNNPK